jgi:tRNA dimethylallyltransferase
MEPVQPPLVAIVGPTAVGKTDLVLRLADRLDLEVVSADSRQIYRGMDIGTAKPSAEERSRVCHHLLDLVEPGQSLTLAQYQQLAFQAIDSILARGRLPFLVGGTGLYVWSVLGNWRIPRVPPDHGLRQALEAEAKERGALHLHRRLAALDPVAAQGIHPNNVRRVIRALEVQAVSGIPASRLRGRDRTRYRCLIIGLTASRNELYERADRRVEAMLAKGLVAEVRRLLDGGVPADCPAMSGIGYRQICEYLAGLYGLDEAVRRIKTATHRFIRQQNTWFRLDDRRISWHALPVDVEAVAAKIEAFLANAPPVGGSGYATACSSADDV